ncbi:purine-nucleoside phosphorylase [Symbiobacterium terraclitae]|uniref:purine-nucleoside phosphorylase n=1 Tax=Symbiobacterium terraclitae TaxID=557451 RepID=UPI0035B532CE
MSDLLRRMEEARAAIAARGGVSPKVGLILGSGLGDLADQVEGAVRIPYGEIPHFPVSTVPGHAGQLVIGHLEGQPVVAMQGRVHFYEGYTMEQVTFPVRVMRALGVETLIVTCAAGGLNPAFSAGDLMLIVDHINMMGQDPLRGPNADELGPRFPAMVDAYTPELRKLALAVADELGIALRQGVYSPISGPSFNTSAELRMLQRLGSDAVGMSTVPEVVVARHMGLRVLGVACITDMALPDEPIHLTHEQVMEVALRTKPRFQSLIRGVLRRMAAI